MSDAAASLPRTPSIAGRVPPHNLDAEAAVLSACMLSGDALDEVIQLGLTGKFYSTANSVIWDAIVACYEKGEAVDIVNVAARLRDQEALAKVGGSRYLAQIVDATPAVVHIEHHAQIILKKARVRDLILHCHRTAAEGYGTRDEDALFEEAEAGFVATARDRERTTVRLGESLKGAFDELSAAAERGDKLTGLPTGYPDLDRLLAGLHAGDHVVIAARPGMGKTALALNIATNVAWGRGQPKAVALFSLEMPHKQISKRMLCTEARVDLSKVRSMNLFQDDWQALTEASALVAPLPIWIDDKPGITLLDLRAKSRAIRRKAEREGFELALIIVDYLQLMRGRGHNRENEISEISRGMKELAKELGLPVISLSQLNRECEKRGKDKRPILADLRESGAIEQDADVIIFIYRDEYYNPETTDARGLAELIIAKQRNGPTGKVLLRYTGAYTRFDTLAHGGI